jgi:hypothetical protein
MKYPIAIFTLFLFIAAVSCSKEGGVSEPQVISREDSIKITYLKVNPTKEPYIVLEDPGFEAELIAEGLDTDNQINGKIAAVDADKIEFLGRPILVNIANPEDPHFYTPAFYARYHVVMPILQKEYEEKTGVKLIVNSLDDVKAFKNVRKFYVNFPLEPLDSLNLSSNKRLEVFETWDSRIREVDFRGCTEIKKINFTHSPHPLPNTNLLDKIHIKQCLKLEYLSYVSKNVINIDVSGNVNLKHLEIKTLSSPSQHVENVLDLCSLPHLTYFSVPSGYYKKIYLQKKVYDKIEISRQQNLPNGLSTLHLSGAEISACK